MPRKTRTTPEAMAACDPGPVPPAPRVALARRLVVRDPNGATFKGADGHSPHWQIDLSGVGNASLRMPLQAVVQQQCSLGCWHDRDGGTVDLPHWDLFYE